MRVEVPFGRSSKIGIIAKVSATSDFPLEKIKPINQILDETPLLSENLIRLQSWVENYYHASPGEAWFTILPSLLAKGETTEIVRESYWQITTLGIEQFEANQIKKNAVKQKQAMQKLYDLCQSNSKKAVDKKGADETDSLSENENFEGIYQSQLADYQISSATLKSLAGKKWVERKFNSPNTELSLDNRQNIINTHANKPTLNQEQKLAVNSIENNMCSYKAWLLFGVTASGKTEVYLRAIESVVAKGQQALVLVPEIGLTPQTVSRFKNRFNVEIATLHSGLTDKQRLQIWLKAKAGIIKVIIGTRSAVFVPMKNPGIIIVDEEHDLSFKQQQSLRYSARDIAMVRAKIESIPVVLASATPSVESLYNVKKKKIQQLDLNKKAQTQTKIDFHVIDMRMQPIKLGLSHVLIETIGKHLSNKGQILLFLNRRGYSPVLLCHDCGVEFRVSTL